MFDNFKHYQAPTVEKINKDCTVATYNPVKKGSIIIGINTYNNNTIYLKSNTLVVITNSIILKLLNTLPKIKNKRVSGKRPKK